jgi:predicted nucleotidyltransferase component of viral defense system
MSKRGPVEHHGIDVSEWVDRVRTDPVAHRQRQATELILNAVAMSTLCTKLYLKGGVLMGLAYDSPRQTADIDLTATFDLVESTLDEVREVLDRTLSRARVQLGYDLLLARVQKVVRHPRNKPDARFPALQITVGYAERGSAQAKRLDEGRAASTIVIDVSFNEETHGLQVLELTGGQNLYAYSLIDLMAEKYRAMLQQVVRNRSRRQDTYDLHRLISTGALEGTDGDALLTALRAKCRSRDIEPTPDSLDDPEVRERAAREWNTMGLELGEVPPFDECYAAARAFYRELPWDGG